MNHLLLQFCPALRARGVLEVTPEFLEGRGIRALILDLDNTLVAWHGQEVAPEIAAWVRQLQAAGVALCIVSNTHRPRRLSELATLLGVQWVPSGGKPRRRGFRRAMAAMGVTEGQTAVIGDQVLTDIWGGNRCGLLTILVEPLSPVEFWGTRVISRRIERFFLKHLEGRGIRAAELDAPPPSNADVPKPLLQSK
jgi:HAD superfamily phosphatase (TIGR01668 family)